MKVTKLSKVFDFIFGASFLFLVIFILTRYFLHDIVFTLLLSLILTMCICTIFHILYKNKAKKTNFSKKEAENAQKIANFYLFSTQTEILQNYYIFLNAKYSVTKKTEFLMINNSILYPIFKCEKICDRDILSAYTKTKKIKNYKLIITCKAFDEYAKQITNSVTDKEIVLLDADESYKNIYKPLSFTVPNFESKKESKKDFHNFLNLALNKSRTKGYVLIAIFLLISSFVLRYNIYYIVFASLTSILALYSYFNLKFNEKPTSKNNIL